MRFRALIIGMIFAFSCTAQIFVSDSIKALLSNRIPDPVEGVWLWPDDGAVMLVLRRTETSFTISLLDSPNGKIRPGKVIGTLISAPKIGEYDCHFDPSALGKGKARSKDCAVKIIDTNRLMFSPYRRHESFSMRKFIPYLFRLGFIKSNRPVNLDGARRIFPPAPNLSGVVL